MNGHAYSVEGLGHYPEGSGELWNGLPFGSHLPFINIIVQAAGKMVGKGWRWRLGVLVTWLR